MTDPNRPLPYADDVETIPVDEAEDIQQVIQALELILARSQAKSGQFRADVHVKTHGYAQGELRVLPNLPDELAQGLFGHDGVYPAVVRFSNAASQAQFDAVPDGRGMAIKVLGVEGDVVLADEQRGPAQDFVMINHPVFFARNVKDYLRLEQVLVQADDKPLATLQAGLTGGDWNPLHWHWREMLAVAQIAGQIPAHPASITYFSMAPIRFGNFVAKYRAKPAGDRHESYLALVQRLASQTDAMRLALEETLDTQEVLFEFQVQLRTSEQTMPIEDATVEWPETRVPVSNGRPPFTAAPKDRAAAAARRLPEPLVQRLACARRTSSLGRYQPRPPPGLRPLLRLASSTSRGEVAGAAEHRRSLLSPNKYVSDHRLRYRQVSHETLFHLASVTSGVRHHGVSCSGTASSRDEATDRTDSHCAEWAIGRNHPSRRDVGGANRHAPTDEVLCRQRLELHFVPSEERDRPEGRHVSSELPRPIQRGRRVSSESSRSKTGAELLHAQLQRSAPAAGQQTVRRHHRLYHLAVGRRGPANECQDSPRSERCTSIGDEAGVRQR